MCTDIRNKFLRDGEAKRQKKRDLVRELKAAEKDRSGISIRSSLDTVSDENLVISIVERLVEIERLEARVDELRKELDRPTDEKLAEAHAKIKKLEEENKNLSRKSLYLLSDKEELAKKNAWRAHREMTECRSSNCCYEVTPTGLGSVVTFVCKTCGYRRVIANNVG